jgi:CO/xanthine dehydrogenase Mo-binding subunit
MGIGHALHEYLPLYEDGPGDGTWNWHRYRLPRASDVAVWRQTADILAPRSERDPPKGMAESGHHSHHPGHRKRGCSCHWPAFL